MSTLCVIIGRGGSKGLPGKNVMEVCGRPMIAWTIDGALVAQGQGVVDRVVVSTDSEEIAGVARRMGVGVIERPSELASDTATVDAAVRHAVGCVEEEGEAVGRVVILYGNVPVRPDDLIDRALAKLTETGCDSVQSVGPVGKMHPYWMKKLEGDRLVAYEENDVYRRQELPGVYMLDGGIIAVTRASLMRVEEGRPHAFLGEDRRAVVTGAGEVVDVDEVKDVRVAEAVLGVGGAARELVIDGKKAGEGCGVYVIAEIGVNHDGEVERALELVRMAGRCGADAVKLQLFDVDRLMSDECEFAAYQRGAGSDPREMLRRLELSEEEMKRVGELVRELGLGFVVTPFSIESVAVLSRLGVDAVKIASPDCVNVPLVREAAGLGLPMLISMGTTGAGDRAVVDGVIRMVRERVGVGLLKCVSAYPVPAGESGVVGIGELAGRYGLVAGYSDHTTDERMGMMAVCAGARVLEKHVTYDTGAAGPDHAASFDEEMFARYVQRVRVAEREMLESVGAREALEADVRRVSRQSVCAVRDLKAGAVVKREDVTVKRPGTGIPAARLDAVVGMTLARDVRANRLLHEEDVSDG